MSRRDVVLATFAFLAGLTLSQWINVGILCRGDPKFGSGCGGIGLAALDEAIALTTTLLMGFGVAWYAQSPALQRRVLWLAVALTLLAGVVLDVGPWYRWTRIGPIVALSAIIFIILRRASGQRRSRTMRADGGGR